MASFIVQAPSRKGFSGAYFRFFQMPPLFRPDGVWQLGVHAIKLFSFVTKLMRFYFAFLVYSIICDES
jgi:hypothetical protein